MRGDRRTLGAAAGILAIALVGAATARSGRSLIRVRWEPPSSDDIAGYRIYTRSLDAPYGDPQDVGLPAADGDGSLRALVPSLEGVGDHAFAVTAYTADGTESVLSNELVLYGPGVRAACTELHCAARDDCSIAPSRDGIACYQDDPCNTGGCAGGVCAVTASATPGDGLLVRFVMRKIGQRVRLVAGAALPAPLPLRAALEGTTIELRDAAGKLLYGATVPGRAFHWTRHRHALVYRRAGRRRAPAGANGLTRVALRKVGKGAVLSLRAVGGNLAQVPTDERLLWVLRVGDRCARNLGVLCRPAGPDATYCG
jgi:hypothetical protein